MGYNASSDLITAIRLHGKLINIILIQVYGPTTNIEEDEIKSFYASIQEEIDHAPTQDVWTKQNEVFLETLA